MTVLAVQRAAGGPRRSVAAALGAASRWLATLERGLVVAGVAAILGLILLSIVTRAVGRPVFWIDEAAVYVMVALCFVGISLGVRDRFDFAVTVLLDRLPPRARRGADATLSAVGLGYACFLVWCAWRLFDPVGLAAAGFDVAEFTRRSFNFVYTEPTQTLGIPKYLVYLVLPWSAATAAVHAAANLADDLGGEATRPARGGAAPVDGG